MKQKWVKLGLLYAPDNTDRHPKLLSHAANPLPILIDGDVYRVFYSGRDKHNRSSVGAVDIDIVKRKVVCEHKEPFFEHGPKDSFFSDGVSIGNCYQVGGVSYILFMGWQYRDGERWRGDIGRLIVNKDLTLQLDKDTPFIGADIHNPVSLSYPWVIKLSEQKYEMWYGSTKTWNAGNNEMLHVINYASSHDGHHWEHKGLAVPYELGKAQAFSRPTVIERDSKGYDMWFSYRSGSGESYRIGYATCEDYTCWELALDNAGIDVSEYGWDSEMIEYPFVLEHKKQRYMLYNGNGYGKSGFGLALAVDD
jgi:hypothetical protein